MLIRERKRLLPGHNYLLPLHFKANFIYELALRNPSSFAALRTAEVVQGAVQVLTASLVHRAVLSGKIRTTKNENDLASIVFCILILIQ